MGEKFNTHATCALGVRNKGKAVIAPHTLRHAIQYLRDTQITLLAHGWEHPTKNMELTFLLIFDPHKPCAAYGLAKRTFRRCGSLTAAISDLGNHMEKS